MSVRMKKSRSASPPSSDAKARRLQPSGDRAIGGPVDQHAGHDDDAMEIDADARQSLGVRELLQAAEIPVHLALDRDDDVAIARGGGEAPPEAARRARSGEEREAHLRRRVVERGSP